LLYLQLLKYWGMVKEETGCCGVIEKPHVWGLFKNVQMQGAQKTESRGVYRYTLSGAVCSATQQMSVFQQPRCSLFPILTF
jgi:hypothetical protein